jgi:hypothetical protein
VNLENLLDLAKLARKSGVAGKILTTAQQLNEILLSSLFTLANYPDFNDLL